MVRFGVPPPAPDVADVLCDPAPRRTGSSPRIAGCLRIDLGVEMLDPDALGVGVPNAYAG